jgi:GINS complex subunit 1
MYGEKATELIRHITRDDHEIMPEYKYDLVEQVLKETDELYNENLKTSQTVPGTHDDNIDIGEKELMIMQVRHTAKLWNKRCLIAYHYERLNRLKQLRWDYGNNLPREIVDKLSKNELEWFTTYNNNLFSYMSALNDGKGLDLTLYSAPPKKLFIQVKCVRDYGQFDMEDGQPVMLKKDSIHYLPLSQCEKLIHQGVLEQTSL